MSRDRALIPSGAAGPAHPHLGRRVPSRARWHAAICVSVAALAGAGCADRAIGPASAASLQSDHVVTTGAPATLFWQQAVRDAIVRGAIGPQPAARALALVSLAQYVAVLHAGAEGGLPRLEAERGAIAAASAAVLSYVFPADAARFDGMLSAQREQLPLGLQPYFAHGEATGRGQAARVIERARTDGFTAVWTGTVPVGSGLWVSATAPISPLLGQMRPFFLVSGSQFRPGPPPVYGSPEFLAALAEVRHISDTRTAEQVHIAQYWGLSTGSITTEGWWNQRAAELIASYGLDELAAARALALVHMAAMDALIGCFDAKYTYWFIRPSQADPPSPTNAGITLAIPLPSHPSYPSAHTCLSRTSAEVLGALFPSEAAQLAAAADQAGLSRIYAGIHYRFDIDAGAALAHGVAQYALAFERERGLLAALSTTAR